jgi:hypothetical protein
MKKNQPTVPKSFPISLEDALRHILPGVKHCDRWRDYRHFIEWQTQWERKFSKEHGHPAPEQYSMEHDKATPLSQFEFINMRHLFLGWRAMHISTIKSESGRAGGKVRAAQQRAKAKRRKKRLTR